MLRCVRDADETKRGRAALWTALVCSVVSLTAQTQTPLFRSGVDLVEIDLRVVDRQGAPITDLTAADLEVRENGVPQRVANLVRVSVPMPTPVPPTSPGRRPPAPDDVTANYGASDARVYVLVLDDLHVDGRRTLTTRRLAHAMVDRLVGPGDQTAVLFASGRSDAAQPFTSNRARLHEAIDSFVGRKLRSATLERQEVYNQFFRGNRGRPRPEDLRDTADQERSANVRAALRTMASATSMLGRIEGKRKAVMFVSEGFDYDVSGLTNQSASPASGISMTPGSMMTGLDGGVIGQALGQLVGLASRANVTFYSIDPRAGDISDDVAALQAPPDDPSLRINQQAIIAEKLDAQSILRGLASQTGGAAFLAPGGLERFDRIARESSDYYLLRYSPEEPMVRGEFREVRVTVRREGAQVSARRGYYARPAGAAAPIFTAPGIAPALGAALAYPLPADGLPLRAHAAAMRGDRKTAQIAITLQTPGAVLLSGLAAADRLDTALEVGVVAIDAASGAQLGAGHVVDVKLDTQGLATLRTADYRVITRLAAPPGRYQLRVGVRDRRTERLGVATLDLDVPDFSDRKPALSSLMLTSRIANLVPTASDADTAQRLALLPTAVRRFTTSDELAAGVEVYGADRARGLTLRTSLDDPEGRRVLEASTPVDGAAGDAKDGEAGGSRHIWPVPLTGVTPGRYIVAVELWRDGSKTALARRETTVFVSGASRER